MEETTNDHSFLVDWGWKAECKNACLFFLYFFKITSTLGSTIKTSSSLDAVTLRYCSISVMASLLSIGLFALLSRFCTQKSNYGLFYIKVLISYYGEGQRASFICSLYWNKGQCITMLCISQHSQQSLYNFINLKLHFVQWHCFRFLTKDSSIYAFSHPCAFIDAFTELAVQYICFLQAMVKYVPTEW